MKQKQEKRGVETELAVPPMTQTIKQNNKTKVGMWLSVEEEDGDASELEHKLHPSIIVEGR